MSVIFRGGIGIAKERCGGDRQLLCELGGFDFVVVGTGYFVLFGVKTGMPVGRSPGKGTVNLVIPRGLCAKGVRASSESQQNSDARCYPAENVRD
jgi:hypothetical protein